MTTLTKAAQDAATEIDAAEDDAGGAIHYSAKQEIILRHLAPAQAELDRLKREMNEARELIALAPNHCLCLFKSDGKKCYRCKAKSWLERNK